MKKILPITFILGFTLFLTVIVSNAQTPQDFVKSAEISIVSLTMDNGNYGSGFFVSQDKIATSYHLVEGALSGKISPISSDGEYPITGITAIDKENDLVILKIAHVEAVPLPIGDSEAINVSDTIYVIGDPDKMEVTATANAIRGTMSSPEQHNPKKVFVLRYADSHATSGRAVLNNQGEVIGILKCKNGESENSIRDSCVVVPSEYLVPLLVKEPYQHMRGLAKPLNLTGVTMSHLTWGTDFYEFTLHNQRDETIRDLDCLIIFRDKKGSIICADRIQSNGIMTNGDVSRRYRDFVSKWIDSEESIDLWEFNLFGSTVGPRTKELAKSYEIRILDFYIDPRYTEQSVYMDEEVTGGELTWSDNGQDSSYIEFYYTVQNNRNDDKYNVRSYVVFYDKEGKPIDTSLEMAMDMSAKETQTRFGTVRRSVKQLMDSYEIKVPGIAIGILHMLKNKEE